MKKFRAYIRLTLIFTLIFSIVAGACFYVAISLSGGSFLGYDFSGSTDVPYVNVMLLGVDKEGYRTDVMIFAQLNLIDDSINMLQIPRDTYVANNGRADKKINSAWGVNKEKAVFKEVEMITGLEVDKYVLVDTSQFREIIDTIGGVEYDVPINMDYDDPAQDLSIHLKKGFQKLDGDKAEQFVRFRKNNDGTGYLRGDIDRLAAQQGFIKAAIDQLFSVSNTLKIPKLVSNFSSMIKTNFSTSQLLTYAPHILRVNTEEIEVMTLPGEGKYMNGISYFVHYESKTQDVIDQYFTPDEDGMSSDELYIRNDVIGLNSTEEDADSSVSAKKSILNRLVNIDIIDASDGEADPEDVRHTLEYYGYNVEEEITEVNMISDETQLIVEKADANADKIADALGMDSYIVNDRKKNGSDATLILGKEMP